MLGRFWFVPVLSAIISPDTSAESGRWRPADVDMVTRDFQMDNSMNQKGAARS